ncbi:MAG: sodium/hydrogen exchanger [Caulobacter sp.]|nr:sodium/hydrogen exchanger [Caulobacter sp.]
MAHAAGPGDYKDIVLFLATAGVVVPLFKRLKISPILGFLGAGVVLGPFGLGSLAGQFPWLEGVTVSRPDEIAQVGEFGVVFLLFMIGLELSWERLRLLRRLVFGLGGAQVAISTAVLGGVAYMMGQPPVAAAAIGAAVALSSTAVAVPVMVEAKRMHAEAGRAAFAVLLFQDLAVAPILITLEVLGKSKGAAFTPSSLFALAPAAIGLGVIVLFGRLLLRPMLKSVARAKSEELFMAAALLVVIGAGVLSAAFGLSMALGAFAAGVLLAETEYRHEVEVVIEPFKGLLLGLFFLSLGIRLDLSLLVATPLFIVGLAVGLVAVKGVIVFGLARVFRIKLGSAVETALVLAAGGEFAFVVLTDAMASGVVPALVGQSLLVAATLTMFLIPAMAGLGARVARGAEVKPSEAPPGSAPAVEVASDDGPVMVIGYGRVGRLVGEMLGRHELPWLTVERDPRQVERARREGVEAFYGDASRSELLLRCGLEGARAVVVTMDSPEGTEAVVATVRQLRPAITLVARARDARHAARLYELGATDAVPETIEASLQLSEAVLVDIGVPMGLVIASIHERRDDYRKALNRPEALGGRRRLRDSRK